MVSSDHGLKPWARTLTSLNPTWGLMRLILVEAWGREDDELAPPMRCSCASSSQCLGFTYTLTHGTQEALSFQIVI